METDNVALPEMNKSRIVKNDGRYLIYFTFETDRPEEAALRQREAPESATPETLGEQRNV